jgi:hypothetical protein
MEGVRRITDYRGNKVWPFRIRRVQVENPALGAEGAGVLVAAASPRYRTVRAARRIIVVGINKLSVSRLISQVL